ncbi:ubiquitin carboxyl-terminal hydrolase 16, partial [Silurus asotus]
MGKKRGRGKSSNGDDSSVEMMGKTCVHLRKGADSSWLRKASVGMSWDTCEACKQDREPGSESGDGEDIPTIWICLKCGHRGCGRLSKNQHAIKHYETPHSDPHCLVLSPDTWSVWCYICDDEVYCSNTGLLAQLISKIKKQMLGELRQKNGTCEMEKEQNTSSDTMEKNIAEKDQEKIEEPKENEACLTQASIVPVRGLSNLGNTCFFNAVLQNLSQTWLLRKLLKDFRDEEKTVLITPSSSSNLDPLEVRLPKPGALTLSLCHLLNEIQETKRGVVTPQKLFTQVCKKAQRFNGFQQQDSQELLRYLLDGLKTEENVRLTTGILDALRILGETSEFEQKNLLKEYESASGLKSFVELVFGGELTSTVMCTECNTVSAVTELFLDLSLPVSEESYRKKKVAGQLNKSETAKNGRSIETLQTNGDEDLPTVEPSKYQQKKVKKQAKKQAKVLRPPLGSKTHSFSSTTHFIIPTCHSGHAPSNISEFFIYILLLQIQRRQQKQGVKLTLNSLNNPSEVALPDAPPLSTSGSSEAEKQEEEDEHEEEEVTENLKVMSISEDPQSEEEEPKLESGVESEAESEFVVVNMDPEAAFLSLSSRAAPKALGSSVESSLYLFTQVEQLSDSNSLMCVTCSKKHGTKKKIYTEAKMQVLISSPPPVLTLHLKRFQQMGYRSCKVNRHIQFPQVLDLGPYCSAKCKGVEQGQTQLLYSLYGIVEHSGTMHSGHYTAFVKARPRTHTSVGLLNGATDVEATPRGSWFHISDSSVQPVTEARVQASQAYLLFYERI